MSDRPPAIDIIGATVIEDLAEYGYVIVHPDDVQEQATADAAWGPAWAEGWNACLKRIFGDQS